jgi:hypothetical protein
MVFRHTYDLSSVLLISELWMFYQSFNQLPRYTSPSISYRHLSWSMCNNSFLTMTFCRPFSALQRCFAFWTSWNRKDTLGKSSCNSRWSKFYQHNLFYGYIKGNFICLLSFYEMLSIVSVSHSHMLSDHCWCYRV